MLWTAGPRGQSQIFPRLARTLPQFPLIPAQAEIQGKMHKVSDLPPRGLRFPGDERVKSLYRGPWRRRAPFLAPCGASDCREAQP